jgi:hypothetical protein
MFIKIFAHVELHVCEIVDIFFTQEITRVCTRRSAFLYKSIYIFAYLELHMCTNVDLHFGTRGTTRIPTWN